MAVYSVWSPIRTGPTVATVTPVARRHSIRPAINAIATFSPCASR